MANNNDNGHDQQQSESQKSRRGFAGMDSGRQREIASEGGKAAHQSGHAHEWTPDEAREAGRRGGMARSQNQREENLNTNEEDLTNNSDLY